MIHHEPWFTKRSTTDEFDAFVAEALRDPSNAERWFRVGKLTERLKAWDHLQDRTFPEGVPVDYGASLWVSDHPSGSDKRLLPEPPDPLRSGFRALGRLVKELAQNTPSTRGVYIHSPDKLTFESRSPSPGYIAFQPWVRIKLPPEQLPIIEGLVQSLQ